MKRPQVPEGHKYCHFGRHAPLKEKFGISRIHKDGLQSLCKDCRHVYGKKHYTEINPDYYKIERKQPEFRKRANAWGRKDRLKLRLEVFTHYGNACSCCGEAQIEFLAIDHKNGNGNKHRKELGGGAKMYKWLKRNGYPEDFQALCHNCNTAKHIHGECPHQKAIRMLIDGSGNGFDTQALPELPFRVR